MANKRQNPESIARRQEAVARLRARGMSVRGIVAALPNINPPVLDPDNRPYTKSTIMRDLKSLTEQWHADAYREISAHRAEQLATLREIQMRAWAENDYNLALRTHDRISKLLGTNAPDRVQVDAHISADVLAETERRLIILAARADGLDATALSPALPSPEAATSTGSPPNADDENE